MKDHFYALGGEKSEAVVFQVGRNLGVAPMKHASKQNRLLQMGNAFALSQ